ncbi:hypothetical protein BaRGS_00025693, partial [Batillaria attramentaria]
GCLYEGHTYQQGEKWTKPCEYDCVCDDGSTGHYTCTAVCPTYDNLPQGCVMQQPAAGECCQKPVCNFATQSPSGPVIMGGPGTHTGTGGTQCVDKVQNCASYGQSVCSDPQYSQWVAENCQAFCGCGGTSGGGVVTGGGTGGGVITGSDHSGGTGGGVITGGGTGGGVITGGGTCADKLNNCAAYGASACTDPSYSQWAAENCANFCHMC